MIDFDDIINSIKKNVEYYSYYVSRNSKIEYHDAKQEILLRLFISKDKYNEKLSCKKTYFITVAKKEAMHILKNSRNNKNSFYNDTISYNEYTFDENNNKREKLYFIKETREIYDYVNRVELSDIFDRIENLLDKNAKKIFELMRQNNFDLDDIAKFLNTTKQNICNIVRRKIRPILKKMLIK